MEDRATGGVRVAFLRGMNLGGRRLANRELEAAAATCGCLDVRAHQASGNLVLTDDRPEVELRTALEDGLLAALGFAVTVFLRDPDEVRALVAAKPFTDAELAASTGQPQVVLLQAPPTPATQREIAGLVPDGDRLVVAERQLHWLPAAGLARNTLDLRRLDALTGGTTIRTRATLERLAARYL